MIVSRLSSFFVLAFLCGLSSWAQHYDGQKGFSVYQKYDKTFITSDLRGKHGASLGFGSANVSPQQTFEPKIGGHLGYNYIVLRKRKRVFAISEVLRDEVTMGFGLHLSVFQNKEWFLNAVYLNPLFSMRGKIISLYWFSEVGFGLHRSPAKLEKDAGLSLNWSLEPLRIRFGKSPLNLCFNVNLDLGSSFLSKNRIVLTSMGTLRYYIYKKK